MKCVCVCCVCMSVCVCFGAPNFEPCLLVERHHCGGRSVYLLQGVPKYLAGQLNGSMGQGCVLLYELTFSSLTDLITDSVTLSRPGFRIRILCFWVDSDPVFKFLLIRIRFQHPDPDTRQKRVQKVRHKLFNLRQKKT